ncbi:YoaK family protein [Paracoccus ravus]|uniref:YoaK family protein n=1 Tax=Paracoccus ravus TaxID=2447760 RepID=UPI00106E5B6A|nr:YoaK family protein [Paracoccus ravus]
MARRKRILRPIASSRVLVGHRRSAGSDFVLATILAFVAGAANAGGFFALGQYTSHMTGYLSQIPDHLVSGDMPVAATAALAIAAFIAGAGFSSLLINWARMWVGRRQYALPIAIQGLFLLCFAWGGIFTSAAGRLFALACLCFIMGMQNATITKISSARVRTTHATGMATDIGIELGRLACRILMPRAGIGPDPAKMKILLTLIGAFLLGGITGALGYAAIGFFFSLPLALLLLGMSLPALPIRRRPGRL